METGVLNAIESDRGSLLEVSDDFAKLCGGTELLITCFFEQRESNLGKVIGRSDIQVSIENPSHLFHTRNLSIRLIAIRCR
jgi:hypothetical protein